MNSETVDYRATGCCRVPGEVQINENTTQHGCCKLDSYNWLEDIDTLIGDQKFNCVEVRFKNSRKDFFRIPDGLSVKYGDIVAVEASPGHDIGIVSLSGETARLQMLKKNKNPYSDDIKKIYRKARSMDIDKWMHARGLEKDTMVRTRRIVNNLQLEMKINDVEYQGDGTKAIFYYTAEDRVDFRQLIKILAEEFRVRIEMKQIGVRQESGRLGGIGPCGRELCCASWMSKFKSVSTISARTQNLSLNPQKLAGQCGKLKCCLNFEQEIYAEELEFFPDTHKNLLTKQGEAFYRKMDVLKGMMWYSYTDKPDVFIALHRDAVQEIIDKNEKKIIPESLENFTYTEEETIQFDNVIGQDDLSRFDNVKPKRRKNRNGRNNNQKSKKNSQKAGDRNARNQKGNRQRNTGGGNRNNNRNSRNRNNQRNKNNKG